MRPNNIIHLKCVDGSFVRTWMAFLEPFHHLSSREMDVAARIIVQWFKLRESIPDPEVLREVLWSNTSRRDMRESLGMSPAHFQMILAKLKKSGVLENGDINKRFIPNIGNEPRFLLSILFDWSSASNPAKPDDGKGD